MTKELNTTFFKDNGWVKIKNFSTKSEINKIKKNINKFLSENYEHYSGRDINFLSNKKDWKNINSFHKLHDCNFIQKFSKKNKIEQLVKNLLNIRKIKLRASELFAKPKKHGLEVPIHQDNFYWCIKDAKALTMWIALEKTNKENGGLYYFDKSHKLGLLKHNPSYKKGSSQMIKKNLKLKKLKKSYPSLNPGDCLIHHSLMVHGSNKNHSSNSRKGITFQFVNFYSKVDTIRKKKYEKSLKKQIQSRVF